LNDAEKKWQENADRIATFLAGANPNWPVADLKKMMRTHLDLTTQEAAARIRKDWKGDVDAYDKVREEILHMSNLVANGIIEQFPDKFGGRKTATGY
jgi:hypothetical protein